MGVHQPPHYTIAMYGVQPVPWQPSPPQQPFLPPGTSPQWPPYLPTQPGPQPEPREADPLEILALSGKILLLEEEKGKLEEENKSLRSELKKLRQRLARLRQDLKIQKLAWKMAEKLLTQAGIVLDRE